MWCCWRRRALDLLPRFWCRHRPCWRDRRCDAREDCWLCAGGVHAGEAVETNSTATPRARRSVPSVKPISALARPRELRSHELIRGGGDEYADADVVRRRITARAEGLCGAAASNDKRLARPGGDPADGDFVSELGGEVAGEVGFARACVVGDEEEVGVWCAGLLKGVEKGVWSSSRGSRRWRAFCRTG